MTALIRILRKICLGTSKAHESWLSSPSGSYAETFRVCRSDILARVNAAYVSFIIAAWKASISSMKSGSPRLALYIH